MKLILFYFFSIFLTTKVYANLPDLGSEDQVIYTPEKEEALGYAFKKTLFDHYPMVDDPVILSYVRDIGARIVASTNQKRHFQFFVINDDSINAFAGPNGIIGIHTGLIEKVKTEDELASVIAHEVAHVTQDHLSRRISYQQETNLSTLATFLAAVLVGSQDPSAGIATYLGGISLNIQRQLNHSRIHENEADHYGIQYLYKSQYNPYAMSDFFSRLSKESQNDEFSIPEILRTHPVTEARLSKAMDRAQQMPAPLMTKPNSRLNLKFIQARLAFAKSDEKGIVINDEETRCYIELLKKHKKTDCDTRAQKNKYVQLEVALKNRDVTKLERLIQFYPNNKAFLLLQAEMLTTLGQSHIALKILKNNIQNNSFQYQFFRKIAQLEESQNNLSNSNYFLARANMVTGHFHKAKHLLKENTRLHKLTEQQLTEHNQLLKKATKRIGLSKNKEH